MLVDYERIDQYTHGISVSMVKYMKKVAEKQTPKTLQSTGAATVTQVAETAAVSLGTVSRVMNGKQSVAPEIRRKVLTAARSIGFVPKTSTRRLGLLVDECDEIKVSAGYESVLTQLIEKCAHAKGLAVESFDIHHIERALDCSMMAVVAVIFNDALAQLKDVPQLPLITINHPMLKDGIHSIYSDHKEQGFMAARHLIECGHKRIAFLGKGPNEWGTIQRIDGFRSAMAAAGFASPPDLLKFSDAEPIYDIISRWQKNGVTAILNFSDIASAETLHILTNVLGAHGGRDISTITLEDVPLYQYFSPPQTVIRQPLLEMASTAVDLAIDLSSGAVPPKKPANICFHGELIVRESVKNLKVQRAAGF